MKKIIALLLCLALVLTLAACGPSKKEVKTALCGEWGYYVYASAVKQDCYQIYDFKMDDTVTSMWINEDAPGKNNTTECTYKISGGKITLYNEDGKVDTIISYTLTDGVLYLVDTGSGGTGSDSMKRL